MPDEARKWLDNAYVDWTDPPDWAVYLRRLLTANERLEARIAALEAVGAEAMDRYVDAAEKNDALYELEAANERLEAELAAANMRAKSVALENERLREVLPLKIVSSAIEAKGFVGGFLTALIKYKEALDCQHSAGECREEEA